MIGTLRDQLADDLRTGVGVSVHVGWPGRISPPCVLLVPPGTNYVTSAGYGGQYTVGTDAVILVANSTGTTALDQLDALIELVLVHSADWTLGGIDGPSVVSQSGIEYLGTIAHMTKPGRIG